MTMTIKVLFVGFVFSVLAMIVDSALELIKNHSYIGYIVTLGVLSIILIQFIILHIRRLYD